MTAHHLGFAQRFVFARTYDIDEEGVPVFDLRLFSDLGGELKGEMQDVTGDPFYTWDELNQEDMDEFDPIAILTTSWGTRHIKKVLANVKNYDPFEEYYEAPHNDILNFVDHLRFWSGELAFNSPFGPLSILSRKGTRHAEEMA